MSCVVVEIDFCLFFLVSVESKLWLSDDFIRSVECERGDRWVMVGGVKVEDGWRGVLCKVCGE